jgi:hypothetical protein
MKWLVPLLLPILLALGACEVGRMQMPMAPMTLGPSDAQHDSCARLDGEAAQTACRERAAPPMRP